MRRVPVKRQNGLSKLSSIQEHKIKYNKTAIKINQLPIKNIFFFKTSYLFPMYDELYMSYL